MLVVTSGCSKNRIEFVGDLIRTCFEKQTVKPDLMYLYLTSSDFKFKEKELPYELLESINKHNVKLVWVDVDKRECKRWDVFKEHSNDIVVSLDEDIIYPDNTLEMCKKSAEQRPTTIANVFNIGYPSYTMGIHASFIVPKKEQMNIGLCWVSRVSVFPPNTFPLDCLAEMDCDDDVKQKNLQCDESIINAYLFKDSLVRDFSTGFILGVPPRLRKCSAIAPTNHGGRYDDCGNNELDISMYNILGKLKLLSQYAMVHSGYDIVQGRKVIKNIVTMTSWKKRIGNVSRVLDNILNKQTKPIDKLYLNLSKVEFPNKENDLPKDLLAFVGNRMEIVWLEGNDKTFKKLIPTILKYRNEPETRIITIDDDCLYESTFIERFVNESRPNPEMLISNNGCRGMFLMQQCTNGAATLYKPKFFNEILWKGLTKEVLATNEDDYWYSYCLMMAGCRTIKYIPLKMEFFNEVEGHQHNTMFTINVYTDMVRSVMAKKYAEDFAKIDESLKEQQKKTNDFGLNLIEKKDKPTINSIFNK